VKARLKAPFEGALVFVSGSDGHLEWFTVIGLSLFYLSPLSVLPSLFSVCHVSDFAVKIELIDGWTMYIKHCK